MNYPQQADRVLSQIITKHNNETKQLGRSTRASRSTVRKRLDCQLREENKLIIIAIKLRRRWPI
jgi:hypothetical protein